MSKCPRCGDPAAGNFCSQCGTPLSSQSCPSCDAPAPPGSRFCTRCGQALHGGGGPGAGGAPAGQSIPWDKVGWWVAGGAMVVLILLLVFPLINPERGVQPPPATGVGAPAAGTGGGVDLSSMSPREAADRLYGRVMAAAENGNQGEVDMFMPMAIAAYDRVPNLDPDAYFHLSLLHRTAGDLEAALANAEAGLAEYPDHLLNLAAAGDAAAAAGDSATAREYYQRFVEVYDTESAKAREDYQLHSTLLPDYLDTARAVVDG